MRVNTELYTKVMHLLVKLYWVALQFNQVGP
jgi:hypothetical protein